MKIVLNRQEVLALKRFADAVDKIDMSGESFPLKDRIVSTKAVVVSMITGRLTIELTEEMVVKVYDLMAGFVDDNAEEIRAVALLVKKLVPSCKKLVADCTALAEEYDTPAPAIWELKEVTTTMNTENEDDEREVC